MIPKTNDLFKWAEYYLSLGFSVIPLREGKLPAVAWKEFQSRKATRVELMKWFTGSGWGMAIVCGKVSENLVRVDFDDPKDYEALKDKLPPDAPVFKSQRAGGGYGALMRSPEPVPTLPQKSFKDRPKVEIRGEGSITVVPPTPGYTWLKFEQVPQLHVHKWLKDVLDFDLFNREQVAKSVGVSAGDELSLMLKETGEGERSNNLVKIAGMLRARGIDLETATQVMEHNFEEHWPHEGMDWEEARGVFEAAFKRYEHEGVRVTGRNALQAANDDDEGEEVEEMRLDQIKPSTAAAVLIDHLVLSGEAGNTVIAAPAKMGKTSLIEDACITATRGDLVWGLLAVSKPIRVAYVDQERKFEQIRDNQILMSTVIGEPNYDNFHVFAQKTGQFQIDHKRALEGLWDKLVAFKPDLVVLDGWGWFVSHKESDPDYVRPAMSWVKKLRQELKCATIIIHHFKKTQYASGREITEADSLDRIAGLKRLVDQAQTALVYTSITGYDTFNLLSGRTNRPSWDPPKIVIDYDHTTLTHRAIGAEEGQELFDPEMYRELWGKESTESRRVKGMMNIVRHRFGWTQTDLARELSVDKSQVSRWYSGRQNPNGDSMVRLGELYKKAKEIPRSQGKMPKLKGVK
jgi:DNA-binding transcriptional regulator YiaG